MSFEDWQKENAPAPGFDAWRQENTAAEAPAIGRGGGGFGAQVFGKPLPGSQFEGRKTMWQALKHGWEVGGMGLVKGLTGLIKTEAEFSDHIPAPMGMTPPSKAYKEVEKKQLIEWTDGILEAVEINAQENPELPMQLNDDDGFLAMTFDIVSHPEKMLQGMVEAVPLMAEAMLGTIVAGPVGGIAVMAQPIIGSTYADARKEGTDPLPALIQASLTGYGEAAIEQWTFGKKLGLAKGFHKIIEKGGRKVLWEGTKLYGRGMVEEGTQQFNQNLWNWVFTDRSQLLTEGVVQSMAIGGPLELTMGGAFAGAGYALSPKQVPDSEKIRRVETLKKQVENSSIADEGKVELYAEFERTIQDVLAGKFDSAPVEVEVKEVEKVMSFKEWLEYKNPFAYGQTNAEAFRPEEHKERYKWYTEDRRMGVGRGKVGASPAAQLDAAKTVATGQEVLLEKSDQQQREIYEELLESAQEGDEVAAQKIQEMDAAALTAEKNLPTFEVLFEAMLEGDEAAKTAIEDGAYKGAREAIAQLEPPIEAKVGDRGRARVDSTIPASDEQAMNFKKIRIVHLSKLLGLKEDERHKIQNDLIGQKSLKGMNLEEVKKVETYFVAEAKKRGLSTSTGKELADSIKMSTTQKQVEEVSGVKAVAWKRYLQTPGKILNTFIAESKRIERLLEALDGFTEGPIYNSIWKVVLTQSVNSRVSRNRRVAEFKEALVDIMTPELQTDEGITAAIETIQAEDKAAGRKAKKLSRKAVRKLVGDSLYARYISSGREVIIEATATDPGLSLNASERIGVYVAMKNKDSLTHLRFGNLAAFKNPDLAALRVIEAMSPQEREIGDWALKDLEANFPRANQAAKLGLGHELEQQNNYFPIRVLDVDVLRQDDFLSELENIPKKVKVKIRPGETKERRPGATQPLDLDFFSVYLNHINRIEQFIHMAPVAKSVGNILNTKEFRQALSNATSGHGPGLLDRWLKNSIRGHSMEMTPGLLTKAALWSRRKGVVFFLAGNIASVARQYISGFDAAAVHPMAAVYMAQHMAQSIDPRYYKTLEKRMRKLSPEMETRSFERYLANIKHQAQAAGILTGREEWSEKALKWQRWADRRTVVTIWNAFYDAAIHSEAVQKQFDLDGSDEAAIAFANKMAGRTQPMGNIEHLPDFFTRGPIERLLSTFQNQINNRWNFWAHDIYGMRKAGKISNTMVMYRVLFSHILPAMLFGAISRGDLPDDWKDVLFDQTIYLVGPLSLAGRIITDAMLGFSGGRTGVEDALTANVGKTLQAVIKGQPKKAAIPALKTIGGLTGRIPNQLIRTMRGIYDLITGKTDDLRRLIYSEWSLTNYGWPMSKEEKARKREEETWLKR